MRRSLLVVAALLIAVAIAAYFVSGNERSNAEVSKSEIDRTLEAIRNNFSKVEVIADKSAVVFDSIPGEATVNVTIRNPSDMDFEAYFVTDLPSVVSQFASMCIVAEYNGSKKIAYGYLIEDDVYPYEDVVVKIPKGGEVKVKLTIKLRGVSEILRGLDYPLTIMVGPREAQPKFDVVMIVFPD